MVIRAEMSAWKLSMILHRQTVVIHSKKHRTRGANESSLVVMLNH
jgi:hypothetical protein